MQEIGKVIAISGFSGEINQEANFPLSIIRARGEAPMQMLLLGL